jgi:Tol biopolymer transport system component
MTGTPPRRLRTPARLLAAATTLALAVLPIAACTDASSGEVGQVTVTLTEGTNMAASASPDGETLVLAIQSALWSVPTAGGEARMLTGAEFEATWPDWSPDGSRIAFQNFSPDGFYHVWTVAADGSDPRQITSGPFDHREPAWSPDGARIAFSSDRSGSGSYDVWTIEVGTGTYEQRTREDGNAHSPAWSPDGSRLAYASGRFVRAVDAADAVEELASAPGGSVQAPSWHPDGRGVVYQDNTRQIVLDGRAVTTDEDVFPFPVSWLPDGGFVYTADGRPRIRAADGGAPRDVAFSARLALERPVTHNKDHRFGSTDPRPVRGIFSPVLSPDGSRIAFVALNDLWVMEIGQPPVQLTDDLFIEWVPSWSPDGGEIYFSSDRHGGGRPDLHAIDLATREVRRVSVTPESRMVFPVLSPDGRSFAYVDGGDQSLWVHDVASGQARRVAEQAYASNVGKPTWSPDGRTLAIADIQRANTRYREGRNLIRTVDVATGEWAFQEPAPLPDQLSERFEAGPAWSPDGSWMAFVMNSTLHAIPVTPAGVPTGRARQLTAHAADMPSWGGDSRTILYLSNGRLRTIQVDGTGEREIPVDLTWTPATAEGVTVIHAGGLWDGVAPELHRDVEIRITGSRITDVRPMGPDTRAEAIAAGARFIDASELTVMPGLWDTHVHPRVQDFTGQFWAVQLAYGFTTVLSNGASTYHSLLARESLEAGRMVGPRLLVAPIFDGARTYYGHHRGIKDAEVLALELEKARELEMDYLKAYVRSPVAHMRRIAEVANEMGIPAGSHFLSPGIQAGLGGTTHLSATQRMGYGWAESAAGRSYQDVIALYSEGSFHLSSQHTQTNNVLGDDPSILSDERFLRLMPPNYVSAVTGQASSPPTDAQRQNVREDVATPAAILRAGGVVTLGSDTPLAWPALGLHARLRTFAYGVSNHEALQAVTIDAARYSHADHELGTVEAGKIADLIFVRGDPLEDVRNAAAVEQVMKNGVTYTIEEIVRPYR